jgi:hypothetical protein
MMKKATQRIAWEVVRDTVAAMTGIGQATRGLGFVERTPPDAIIKQRAFFFREVGAS